MKPCLSEIIAVLEQMNMIKDFYAHRNYESGFLELNITFTTSDFAADDKISELLKSQGVEEIDSSAFWE